MVRKSKQKFSSARLPDPKKYSIAQISYELLMQFFIDFEMIKNIYNGPVTSMRVTRKDQSSPYPHRLTSRFCSG